MKKLFLTGALALGLLFLMNSITLAGPQHPAKLPGSANIISPLSAREIAQKVYDRDLGDDVTTKASMALISRNGRTRVREFSTYSKDYGPVIKQMVRFTTPADIAGTGFLSIENDDGSTEQFLYLPALGRTRRIVSSQKNRSFVNTDFTYEDMQRRRPEAWEHTSNGSETIDNTDCFIITSTAKTETDTAYSQIKSWIMKDFFMPLKVELWDKKGRHTKSYKVLRFKIIQDIMTETEVVMKNLKKGHQTVIKSISVTYNQNLTDNIFSKRHLEEW